MHQDIIKRIRAGFSGFCVVTSEEVRAEGELRRAADGLGYRLSVWSVTSGLVCPESGTVQDMPDPLDAINALDDMDSKSMLALKDLQHFLGSHGQPPDPVLVRALRDRVRDARSSGKAIVLVGCSIDLPLDLQKEFTTIDLDLPDRDTLRSMAEELAKSAGIKADAQSLDNAAEAARGLTTVEAEDIMALAIVETQKLDPVMIAKEKARCIGRNGILELIEPKETAATFVWTAIPRRMEWRYGYAAHKVVALDAGHVCQNLYLACEAIDARTCAIAAYDQDAMDQLLGVDGREEFTVYLAPVGMLFGT